MDIRIVGAHRDVAVGQIDPIIRARQELSDMGYVFKFEGKDNADLCFIQCTTFKGHKDYDLIESEWRKEVGSTPVILLDDAASSGTHKMRFMTTMPHRVKGYIKKQLLVDKELYKVRYPRKRYHYYMLSKYGDAMDKVVTQDKYMTDEIIAKAVLGWNLGLTARGGMDIKTVNLWAKKRDIDIHFSIKTKHTSRSDLDNLGEIDNHYAFHRVQSELLIEEIAKKHKYSLSGKCRGDIYWEKMRRSKVCVSPLGLGEICFRDFEAVCQGAILIKPEMSHLETWPNLYRPWETYIPVKWDWANLEDTVAEVLGNYKKYVPLRDEAYRVLAEVWKNDVFVKRFDEVMKKVKERM